MKIGFVGLGNMGAGMAGSIQKAGFHLTVLDLRKEVAKPLLDAGAFWADTPKAVAQNSEIIFSSLPGPKEVEAVALGKDGIIEGIREGGVYIDLSTVSPTLARKINDRFKTKKAQSLDAPVSGGPSGTRTRNLAIMVGGDEVVFLQCKPVLDAIGDKVSYVGASGCGLICKLTHNAIGFGLMSIIAECFILGVKAGAKPEAIFKAVSDGGVGKGDHLRKVLPETYFQGKFDPASFALNLAYKDLNLAAGMGNEFRVPMPHTNLVLQDLIAAMNKGWADRDSRVFLTLQEDRAGGVEVRMPQPKSS